MTEMIELMLILIVISVVALVFVAWGIYQSIRNGLVVTVKSNIALVVEAPDDMDVKVKDSKLSTTSGHKHE